jgi:hypothetical protein
MNQLSLGIVLPLTLLVSSQLFAADCTENDAADLNTQVETNLTLLEDNARANAEADIDLHDAINALWEKFNDASALQTQALDSNDQTQMNQVCESYQTILKGIEELNK